MLGTNSTMTLNYADHPAFDGLDQLALDLENMTAQGRNIDQGPGHGPNDPSLLAASGAGGGDGVTGLLHPSAANVHHNGVNGTVGAASLGTVGQQQQQQQTLAPPPPSSWAAKVRAGLGSDSSPTLGGGIVAAGGGGGLGSVGDMTSSAEMDPAGAGVSFGQLSGGGDGVGPGPVHGLSMEAGGMPTGGGRRLLSSLPIAGSISTPTMTGTGAKGGLGSIGAVGLGLGGGGGGGGSSSRVAHQDTHSLQQQLVQQHPQLSLQQQRAGAGAGGTDAGIVRQNGSAMQLASSGLLGGGGEGSESLGRDFGGLNLGGGGGGGGGGSGALSTPGSSSNVGIGAGSAGAGAGAGAGFDACKDDLLGDFPCVRLRGLAADTSVKDILDFFVGLGPVLDIVLEGDATDGEVGAITLFGNLMDYHGALQRYSLQIKGRYIEVAPAVRPDYYAAVINRSPRGGNKIADTGLPPTPPAPTAAALPGIADQPGQNLSRNGPGRGAESSSGAGVIPLAQAQGPGSSAVTTPGAQGSAATGAGVGGGHAGATGVAAPAGAPAPGIQSASSMTTQTSGLAGGVGHGAGGGVGMRKGGMKVPMSGGGSAKAKGGLGGGLTGDGKGAVIRMRGLPYRASKAEVMGFFKGLTIPEEGIAFVTRADGRVTGEAYVRFASREDAKLGIRKDREMMGSRYIELFTSSPEEMNRYTNSKR